MSELRSGIDLTLVATVRALLAAAFAATAAVALSSPADAQTAEAVDHSALRVCADPNNLPFSNDKGEGFENKIAELLAAELGVPVRYTWFPDSVGFIRNTLNARACDVVIGTVSGNELLQNTNPYYRSVYSLVYRPDSAKAPASIDDPVLQTASIGIVAGTPPATILAQKGLLGHLHSYPLIVDTRFDSPARRLVHDVATGEVDVGVVWGPIAGYFAKQESPPLAVLPLQVAERHLRVDFRITMGVRNNEPEWKRTINSLIRKKQAEITQILLDYGVPLLDEKGQPITH
jgi:quinoprotein dehydrogenase-associated probable ABC transporter substrate-binding protein